MSMFAHVRRLPEQAPAHAALRLSVQLMLTAVLSSTSDASGAAHDSKTRASGK